MDFHHRNHRFFNILTVTLPLICFLLSYGATTSSSLSASTAPPSSLAAADILRARGYTLFAATILSTLSTTNLNLSGTIFAPPDFAFSFSTARFSPSRRGPTRPSTSLLLFHTLKPPSLSFFTLSGQTSAATRHLPTLNNNLCLFISKNANEEISISASSEKSRGSVVKVRQPDLYVDDQLTVHGIDGVLDPSLADKCPEFDHYDDYEPLPPPPPRKIPPPLISSHGGAVYRSFLDHAIRVLKRRGFNFVATALAIKRSRLLSLPSVTVFAPSDRSIFLDTENGFHYDFLHHVVPQRLRFESLSRHTVGFTTFETLAVNKSIIVEAVDGEVRVDGVRIDGTEIYFNRWIVVFAIPMTLDDAVEALLKPPALPSPPRQVIAPPLEDIAPPVSTGDTATPVSNTPSSATCDAGGTTTDSGDKPDCPSTPEVDVGVVVDGVKSSPSAAEVKHIPPPPPPTPKVDVGVVISGVTMPEPHTLFESIPPLHTEVESIPPLHTEVESTPPLHTQVESIPPPAVSIPPLQMEVESTPPLHTEVESIPPPAAESESGGCLKGEKSTGLEGEDLFCDHTTVRKLQEAVNVEKCDPSDSVCQLKGKVVAISKPLIWKTEVNIADDLFFYA